jgi:uncharacterized membrane protein YkvA (DUF1232 family)
MGWLELVLSVGAGLLLLWGVLLLLLWRARPPDLTVREAVRLLPDLVRLVRRLATDRSLPRGVRWRLWGLLAYLLSPVDLVPDVVPVLGYADDVVVVALALRWVVGGGGGAPRVRAGARSPGGLAVVRQLAGLPEA